MTEQFADNACGLCGGTTQTSDGQHKVWYYEPRADFYCARHWEQALAEDNRRYAGNEHWRTVSAPLLALTRRNLQRHTAAVAR